MTRPALPSTIELDASYPYAVLVMAVHLAAGAALALVVQGAAGWLLLALVAALGGASAWHRALLRGTRAPKRIVLDPDGSARLELRDGRFLGISPNRVGRRWVAVESRGLRPRSLLVTRGMASNGFRRLCLWALWSQSLSPAPEN